MISDKIGKRFSIFLKKEKRGGLAHGLSFPKQCRSPKSAKN
jgi:hypothetical protein